MTLLKAGCVFVALALCISECFGAVAIYQATVGEPLELSISSTTDPYAWRRKVQVNGQESIQYLFPCACNNGSWTDGTRYFGSNTVARWDGTLRIAAYSDSDAGTYVAMNEERTGFLPQTMITVVTKQVASP